MRLKDMNIFAPLLIVTVYYLFIIINLCATNKIVNIPSSIQSLALSNQSQVIDGNSIKDSNIHIILYGIDALELHQECKDSHGKNWQCGRMAKQRLQNLLRDKKVRCDVKSIDLYKRKLATCYIGKKDINQCMVKDGYALAYIKYSNKYELDEEYAINNNKGIWDGDFQEPEHYRKLEDIKKRELKKKKALNIKISHRNNAKNKLQNIDIETKGVFNLLDTKGIS